jgi:hypothetical protein
VLSEIFARYPFNPKKLLVKAAALASDQLIPDEESITS